MTEKRLIDANAMRQDWLENGENECVYDTNAVLDSIDAQPTVNAVEVVRCKDCKYSFKNNGHSKKGCPINDARIWMDDDDFCSYGERRADD